MRVVLQVVKEASVTIDGKEYSSINDGFLLLVGFTNNDNLDVIKKVINKIVSLRIFPDENGKTNLGFDFDKQEILCVSQFTLYADIAHGRRPSFVSCLNPIDAKELYEQTIQYLKEIGVNVKEGVFQADMKVKLINDGPFTLMIDSEDL
ncbi:MAG: D-aminoacyl-tRNA deacylase [Bacilli bacterium]|nr:D-aminoacyl-tRNA deacylase [Bacillales bacterium]MDY2574636.1 D-aminoacyl-tRNA deacylase [Bacilli bacterium]